MWARPGWAQGPDGEILAALVLVGSWSDNREADHKIVSEVVNRDYESVERLLSRWENSGDPPFRRSGNSWRLSNPEDAWLLLRGKIIDQDLERWAKSVLEVLGTRDPVLDLDPRERFMASVRGKEHRWSFDLRRGLGQGLALLAALELPRPVGGRSGSGYAESVVRELLERAGQDAAGKLWQQLSDVLPLLAEAAPDIFLEAIRRDSVGEEPLIHKMLTDRSDCESPWNEASAHTGLIWALETVCWSSDHLLDAVESLMCLAELDPGGRLSNHATGSAVTVLLPWHPQTGASLDRRLDVLGGVLRRHEQVGQDMAAGLLSRQSMSLNTSKPQFRDWVPDSQPVTMGEFQQSIMSIVDRALDLIKHRPSAFVVWIDQLPQMFVEAQRIVVEFLQGLDKEGLEDSDRFALWEVLNDLLSRFSDETLQERWLFPGGFQMLKRLTVDLKVEGSDFRSAVHAARTKSLFGWDRAAEGAREAVVKSTYESGGFDALFTLTENAENSSSVGVAAANVLDDSILLDLLKLMSTTNCDNELAFSWIRKRADNQGMDWVEEMASILVDLRKDIQTLFFRSVRPDSSLWKLLELQDQTVCRAYWQSVSDLIVPAPDLPIYVSSLLTYNRPWLAVRAVTLELREAETPPIQIDDVEKIITKLTASGSKHVITSSDVHRLGKLLDVLERERPDSDVQVATELALFRVLPSVGHAPKSVYRMLQSNPTFYVDLVCLLISQPTEMAEAEFVSRDVAWSVVHGWKIPPDTDSSTGRLSYLNLGGWVDEARRLFQERKQSEVGDLYIGELLASSVTGTDAAWPAEEVRDLLERANSDQLETGLMRGALDLRGEIARGPFEGGKQERDIARRYLAWAEQVDAQWPRTGRVLRRLARSYERDAALEDERAERLGDFD